jgi:N-acetylneuraminic acid mutarotase
MSAQLGKAKTQELDFSMISNVKRVARKIHKQAAESVLKSKSGKRNNQKNEPYPGDLAFGSPNRLFADSEYNLYASQSEYDKLPEWKRLSVGGRSFIPPNRENCASAVVGNELYMFGGLGGGPEGRYNLLCALNFNSLNWRIECPIEGAPPAPCCKHSMVEYDRSVYIYGGEGEFEGEFSRGDQRSTRQIHNKMYKYDTRSARWHALPTVGALPERRIPFARRSHSAVVVKNFHSGPSILIWAGAGLEPIKARDRLFNDMWAFNIEEETWTFVYQKGNIPTPRSGHSATLIGDLMYVFGGLVNAGSGNGTTEEIFCFDTKTLTWSEVPTSGSSPGGIYNHAALYHPWSHKQGKILVFGGRRCASSDPPSNKVYCFDIANSRWEVLKTLGRKPTGRFAMCAWNVRKCIVAFGGCNSKGYCNSDLAVLALPDPPYANIQDDIMARLSKMDSRDMLRGDKSMPNAAENVGDVVNSLSAVSQSQQNASVVINTGSTIDPSTFSAIPEPYDDPVPSIEKLRSYTPSMSYRAFKGVTGQGRSALDSVLPTGELRASIESTVGNNDNSHRGASGNNNNNTNESAIGLTLESPSATPGSQFDRSVSAGNLGQSTMMATPNGAGGRSTTAPSGSTTRTTKGMGHSLSTPSLRPGSMPPLESTLDGGASALPPDFMKSILGSDGDRTGTTAGGFDLTGGSTIGGDTLGGINSMNRPRSKLSIKDIITLGNGSFFVDQQGNDEERSVLSDKTWIRQHLHRSYVPPRRLRSQGHIYLRGRDSKRKMALGERDLPSLLPPGAKIKVRPTTSIGLARVPKISARMLRRKNQI